MVHLSAQSKFRCPPAVLNWNFQCTPPSLEGPSGPFLKHLHVCMAFPCFLSLPVTLTGLSVVRAEFELLLDGSCRRCYSAARCIGCRGRCSRIWWCNAPMG